MTGLLTYAYNFANILDTLAIIIDGTDDDAKFLLKSLLQHDIIHDSDYPDEFMTNPLVPDAEPIYSTPTEPGYEHILKHLTSKENYRKVYSVYNEAYSILGTLMDDNRNSVITIMYESEYTYIIIGPSIKEYRYNEAVDALELEKQLKEDYS